MLLAIRVKARYEDKVLKPLEEVELEEGDEVEISIVPKVKNFSSRKLQKLGVQRATEEEICLSGILRRYGTERI